MHYLFLGIAILSEVVATSALKNAEGFTRLLPSLVVAVGYGAAFYFLSLALRAIPIGVSRRCSPPTARLPRARRVPGP